MISTYDMCVSYDILLHAEENLREIEKDLTESIEQMTKALIGSHGFLSGSQYEKAKEATQSCLDISRKTGTNIRYALSYLSELKEALDDYGRCAFGVNE